MMETGVGDESWVAFAHSVSIYNIAQHFLTTQKFVRMF